MREAKCEILGGSGAAPSYTRFDDGVIAYRRKVAEGF